MKYYSEILNKTFESEKDCLKAEENYKAEQYKEKTSRKLYADKVAVAEKKIAEANANYKEAKNKVEAIKKEALLEINEVLDEANQKLADARKEYDKALLEFTNKFGVYTKTFTGKDAEKVSAELKDTFDVIDTFLSYLF